MTNYNSIASGDIRNYKTNDIILDVFPLNQVFCGWTIKNMNNVYINAFLMLKVVITCKFD